MVRDSKFLTEFEKMPAREGLVKMFGEHGGRVPTKGELTLLEQIFPAEFIKTVMEKRPFWEKIKEAGWQLANIPRAVMASFDLSFGLRQGAFMAPRYRKQFWDSWKGQFKIFGSEKAYQASRQALTKHPDFMFAKQSKVSFTELGKIMAQREEAFASQWAEKIPGVGIGIRASSRAYTSYANKYRLDIFSRMVKDAEGMGFKPRKNPLLARKIADFINNGTGRGHLGSFESSAVALNALFFSPRLNMARMKLLNPIYYIKQPKFVRTQAIKTALTASGTAVTILTLAELTPGVEAGWNPLSADFGKIKIRNTRIDILAGFGQFMRAGAQLLIGRTISTTTGKETILGEGYKPRTRLDILLQQVEYKESPLASFATTLLKGKDFAGEDVSIPKEVGRRFIPMVVADIVELAKEDPRLLPLGIPAVFGVGLQTYAHPYDKFVKIEKEYGRGGAEWQKAKKEFEDSGYKFNLMKYLEYKKTEKGEPISTIPKTEEVTYAGMFPGASIIDKPLMRMAGKVSAKVKKWLEGEPKDWQAKYYKAILTQDVAVKTHERGMGYRSDWQKQIIKKHKRVLDTLKTGNNLDEATDIVKTAIKSHELKEMPELSKVTIKNYENVLSVLVAMKEQEIAPMDTVSMGSKQRTLWRGQRKTETIISMIKDIALNKEGFQIIKRYTPNAPPEGGVHMARQVLKRYQSDPDFDYERAKKELEEFIKTLEGR